LSAVVVLFGRGNPLAPFLVFSVDARSGDVSALGPSDVLRALPGGDVVLVLPGSDAQVRRLSIPARTEAQARGAAPYLFEGALAEAPEAMHYAVGDAQNEAGDRLVAAIAESRLTAWLDACRRLGADPVSVFLDCTIWPAPASTVDVVNCEGQTIVAGGRVGGYTIESDLAPTLFRQWLGDAGASVGAIRLSVADAQSWHGATAGAAVSQMPGARNPTLALAAAAANPPEHAPDLRQGSFAHASEKSSSGQTSRIAISLVLVAFCLQVGALALAGYRDNKASSATISMATQDLRAARPEIKRIVNLRAQVSAARNAIARSGAHPVLSVNNALITTLRAHPAVQLDEVRHVGPGRRVALRVSAPDTAALDAMSAALKQQNITVETRGLQPVEGRYAAELSVEAP